MIVWTGLGILTLIVCGLGTLIISSILEYFGVPSGLSTSIGFFISAILNWFLGKKLNGQKGKILKDEKTGELFEYKEKHTLFWIPMEYLSVVYVIVAIIYFVEYLKGQ